MAWLLDVLLASWQVLVEAAPSLLLGYLVAGLLHALLPTARVLRLLGGAGLRPILMAAAVGIPLPLCSCSVIPAAAELRRKGAGRGAVAAFLVATPETGVDSISVSFALLHPVLAVFRPLAALLTAVACGILVGRDAAQPVPAPAVAPAATPRRGMVRALLDGVRYGFTDLFATTAPWLVPAMVVSGVLVSILSPEAVARTLPPGLPQMLALALLGMPLYVCATAATPVAASLIVAGFSPGAALVFLLTGPATNLATMAAVRRLLGGRAVAVYVATILAVSVLLGLLLDALLPALGVAAHQAAVDPRQCHASPWSIAAAGAVLLLLALDLLRRLRKPPAAPVGATPGSDACCAQQRSCCGNDGGSGGFPFTLPGGSSGASGSAPSGAG